MNGRLLTLGSSSSIQSSGVPGIWLCLRLEVARGTPWFWSAKLPQAFPWIRGLQFSCLPVSLSGLLVSWPTYLFHCLCLCPACWSVGPPIYLAGGAASHPLHDRACPSPMIPIHIIVIGFLVCLPVGDLYQDRYVNGSPWAHGPKGPRLRSIYVTVLG